MRKQRAFAGLTEQEIDQIAEWLRRDNYNVVRERIARPRPDGFGLTISTKPLQLLYAKSNRVDKINARIASGQKLTLSEFDAINGGEREDVTDEVHNAIMDATYDLATSGDNTPTQLLALQRLADFPARAELRAERREGEAQMRAHKIEMDAHRKKISEERLELSKRSFELREKQLAARTNLNHSAFPTGRSGSDPQSEMSDHLGPYATTLDEIKERARRKFGLPLPTRNRRPEETLASEESASQESPGRDAFHRVLNTASLDPDPSPSTLIDLESPEPSLSPVPPVTPSPCPSEPSVVENSDPSLSPLPPVKPSVVQNHAIRRWRSYLPRRYFDPLPDETWTEECPCGTKLPCDLHATLWVQVRYLKPSDPDYIAALTRHGISVYVPKPEELHVPSQSASQESPGREAFHCVPNIEPNGEELLCDTQAND